MIDVPDQPDERPTWPCMRCGKQILIEERYVYCSWECQDADVPTEPGRGGVRS